MSKQRTVINYNELVMDDFFSEEISDLFDVVHLAKSLYEEEDSINSAELAYEVACNMNGYVDNMCEYERKNIIEYLDYIVQYHEEDCEEE